MNSGPAGGADGTGMPNRPGTRSASPAYAAHCNGPTTGETGRNTRAPHRVSSSARPRPPASSSSGTYAQTTIPAMTTPPRRPRILRSRSARTGAGTAVRRSRTSRRNRVLATERATVSSVRSGRSDCMTPVCRAWRHPEGAGARSKVVAMTSSSSPAPQFRTAVVPAAGLGTRFLPATKTVPKELLPVVDTPGIELIAEEATEAGAGRLAIVTSERKVGVMAHFEDDPVLEGTLEGRGKEVLLHKVRRAPGLIEVVDVRQEEPLGLGHAIAQVEPVLGDEEQAVAV